jgi:hypothetical protein
MKKVGYIFIIFIFFIALTSAHSISTNRKAQTGKYEIEKITGIEAELGYEIEQEVINQTVIITACTAFQSKNIEYAKIDKEWYEKLLDVLSFWNGYNEIKIETNFTYEVPTELKIKKEKELSKVKFSSDEKAVRKLVKGIDKKEYDKDKEKITYDKNKFQKETKDKYCYEVTADPRVDKKLKLGENSIYLIAEEEIFSDSITNNVRLEANFSHLEMYDNNSFSQNTGFNISRRLNYAPYFQDDDNSYLNLETGDSVLITNNANLAGLDQNGQNFTISLWVFRESNNGRGELVGRSYTSTLSAWTGIQTGSSGNVLVQISNGTSTNFSIEDSVTLNEWVHYTATYDGTNVALYKNGELEETKVAGIIPDFSSGGRSWGINLFYETIEAGSLQGKMDNVMILNRSLSSSEVLDLYDLGRKQTTYTDSNLISNWRFDDPTDAEAVDSLGAINGTFYGDATYGYDIQGLLAYYPFDGDRNVTAYDYSSNDNDGTYSGAGTSNSIYGFGAEFDGVNDYIDFSNYGFDDDVSTGSFALWFKYFDDSPSDSIFWRLFGDGLYPRMNLNDGRLILQWEVNDSEDVQYIRYNNFVNDYSSGEWIHLAGSFDSENETRLYINGELYDTYASDGRTFDGGVNTFEIGRDTNINYYTNGSIDEVMIFSNALNSSQVSDIYNNQSQRFKSFGLQTVKQFNMTLEAGDDTINVTLADVQAYLGSNISLRLGKWKEDYGYINKDIGGGYVDFDGVDDYIEMNSPNQFLESGSLSVWAKSKSAKTGFPFSHHKTSGDGDRLYISLRNSGDVWLGLAGSSNIDTTSNHAIGTWGNYIVNWNSTSWKLYKDGAYVDTGTYSGAGINLENVIDVGRNSVAAVYDKYFNGSVDEVMIFNNSLSENEIQDLYISGRNNLQGYSNDHLFFWMDFDNQDSTEKISGLDENYIDATFIGNYDSLVSHWALDGNADDQLGLINGTINGATVTNNSKFGQAYDFDGVNDYIQYNPVDETYSEITISAWSNYHDTGRGNNIIYDSGDIEILDIHGGGSWKCYYNNGSGFQFATCSDGYETGEWFHTSCSWDGSTIKIYKNGVECGSTSMVGGSIDLEYFTMGSSSQGSPDTFINGTIDDVMIFNRSLSDDEVKELYVKGLASWDYTEFETYEDGVEFAIDPTETNFLPDWSLIASPLSYMFSPILSGSQQYEGYQNNTAPNISIDFPNEGDNLTGNISINWTASDERGDTWMTNITLSDGTVIASNLGYTISNYTWDSSNVADNFYNLTITIWENETAEGYSANDTISIGTENYPPTRVDFVNPTLADGTYNQNYIEGNVSAYDLVDGIENITISLYNSSHDFFQSSSIDSIGGVENYTYYHQFLGLSDGTYYLNTSACTLETGCNSSETRTYILDTTSPIFSNMEESPESPTTYSPTQNYIFEIDVDGSNLDSVWLEFDGTNYSASNVGGNTYQVTFSPIGADNYTFNWGSNNTANTISTTADYSYIINKASPTVNTYIGDLFNNSHRQNRTIYQNNSIWLNGTTTEAQPISLYLNSSLINSGNNNIGNYTEFSSLGEYNITTISEENQNYSFAYETWFVTVIELPTTQCDGNYTTLQSSNSNKRVYGRLCYWLDFR